MTKILFRGTQAYGVEFYYGTDTTTKYTAFAKKEIIVCAGSILSPVLMMKSGVGPEDVLAANCITPVSISPRMGKGLVEHYAVWHFYELLNCHNISTNLDIAADIVKYNLPVKTGQFAGTGTLPSVSFTRVTLPDADVYGFNNSDSIIESYHLMLDQLSLYLPEFLRFLNYEKRFSDPIKASNALNCIAIVPTENLNPYSSGYVALPIGKNDDFSPFLTPNFTYGMYTDENGLDRKVLAAAMKDQMTRFASTPIYKEAGLQLIRMPVCFEWYDVDIDKFIDCYQNYFTAGIWHPSSSCAMGADATLGVVNQYGQVYGVQGVRIIDASM